MKVYKHILSILFFFSFSISISNSDIIEVTNEFNDLILKKHTLDYPYLEVRNDIGVFYDFSYDEKLNEIKVKRDKNNYPIVRFSLFNKKDIKPGNIVLKYNEKDLSKINDKDLIELHKRNSDTTLTILKKKNKIVKISSSQYKLNDIKLSDFYLNFINTIDTTKGVLEISFLSTLSNEKPELLKYAKDLYEKTPEQ